MIKVALFLGLLTGLSGLPPLAHKFSCPQQATIAHFTEAR